MTTLRPVELDERAVLVNNASYRWAYLVQAFGLLAVAAIRGLLYREASWDLLGLVLLGGAVAAAYQLAHRVPGRRWLALAGLALLAAAAVAMITVRVAGR